MFKIYKGIPVSLLITPLLLKFKGFNNNLCLPMNWKFHVLEYNLKVKGVNRDFVTLDLWYVIE